MEKNLLEFEENLDDTLEKFISYPEFQVEIADEQENRGQSFGFQKVTLLRDGEKKQKKKKPKYNKKSC